MSTTAWKMTATDETGRGVRLTVEDHGGSFTGSARWIDTGETRQVPATTSLIDAIETTRFLVR